MEHTQVNDLKTPLFDRHVALGARIVPFSGWQMPVQYSGIREEHHAVRQAAGIFDVSHMGVIDILGPDAEKLLDHLSTNVVSGKKDGTATYTVWAKEDGTCVDDVIVFREGPQAFYVVVNAGNRDKDLRHVQNYASGFDVEIVSHYETLGILAIQGPKAMEIVGRLIPDTKGMRPFRTQRSLYSGTELRISTTGYTGSGGCEIIAPNQVIGPLWDAMLKEGAGEGIAPIGLGARDTLRLEMGYALYGHELSEDILPNESVSAWTVRLSKDSFLGKEAIEALEQSGKKRYPCAIKLLGKGIAREGHRILKNDQDIGYVSSGTMSPSLGEAIALGLVDEVLSPETELMVEVRGRQIAACVVALPFIDPKTAASS
ncbi:MAG: glycine cleavage system aminomethyltransferase GcvT [Chlamydiia bacterium]|nr:glycine cleavage system aminomethyltransferase GcvT [Chlamydiia bacterium]